MSIVIVQGSFSVAPEERDQFLAASVDSMVNSRAEAGCIEYVLAADPIDPGRVVLSERWESMEHLDRHLEGLRAARAASGGQPANRPTPTSQEIMLFDVSSARPLG